MKLIGMFLFSATFAACSHVAHVAPREPVGAGVMTSTSVKLQEFPVVSVPPAEVIDHVVELMIMQAITASAADQVHMEAILGILHRADPNEIGMIVRTDRSFPIADIYQNIFWHAAIEMANVFLRYPDCAERLRFLDGEKPPDGFFQRRLKYLHPEFQIVYLAGARFLVTKSKMTAYHCRDPVTR